jgi:3-oxoacyl-[acyl-carrier protein] reductase
MNNNLGDRKIILITGTSKGIGRYLAEYYIENGFFVIGCSRQPINIASKFYKHFELDIANEIQIIELFNSIRREFKKIHVLINNAAINPAIISAALLPYNTIEKVFKVNVFGVMLFCREAVKLMARNKFGRIINIGSMATRHEVPGEALYTSSKSAIIAYSRVLAKESFRLGITVNVIAPSAIKTELSNKINQESLYEVLSRNAISDYGNMRDVSNIIDLIIDDNSIAITGQIIYLGGV